MSKINKDDFETFPITSTHELEPGIDEDFNISANNNEYSQEIDFQITPGTDVDISQAVMDQDRNQIVDQETPVIPISENLEFIRDNSEVDISEAVMDQDRNQIPTNSKETSAFVR